MRMALVLTGIALVFATATGCSDVTAAQPGTALKIAPGAVNAAEARQLVAQGITVVDVRTPSEYIAGHLPGAVNIPYDELDRRAAELGPPTTPVLLYCHSGRRSGIAAKTLRGKGYTQLYDLKRYDAWVRSEPGAR